MKRSILNPLIAVVLVLGLLQAALGLFWQPDDVPGPMIFTTLHGQTVEIAGHGVYAWDTVFFAAGFRGMDVVTVCAGVPLLALAWWRWRRGSLQGGLLMVGALTYFVYISASLTFSAAFNRLFLLYVALLACSLYALLFALGSMDAGRLEHDLTGEIPRKGLAGFLVVAGVGTLVLWVSDLIGPLLAGRPPALLGPYTTMFTHGFDSAVITPAALITAVFVWQRKPPGLLLAMPVLVLCVFNGVVVIASTVSQTMAGISFSLGTYIGLIGSWVVLGLWALWLGIVFLRRLAVPACPAAARVDPADVERAGQTGPTP